MATSYGRSIERATPMSMFSINFDLTTACNHNCAFCVDADVLNTQKPFKYTDICDTIDTLIENGLRSVILIGGGEPTLHPDFEAIVKHIKENGLQLGIVSNGSRNDKVLNILPFLQKHDYIRFSIDAATEKTYQKIHRPREKGNRMAQVLRLARKIKDNTDSIKVGYSFVVCWEGIYHNGRILTKNIDEIPLAYQNCIEFRFDYLSLKPCLIKNASNPVEGIYGDSQRFEFSEVCRDIASQIALAEGNIVKDVPIILSLNLQGMLSNNLNKLKNQPKTCHAGFFRQVITPLGIYHCPAYRGTEAAYITDKLGYSNSNVAEVSYEKATELLMQFRADVSCKNIACFYNEFNHAIQHLIDSDTDLSELETFPDENFFF
jgi:hypothetical protein